MISSFHPVQSEVSIILRFDARGVAKRFRQPATLAALDALRNGETMRFVSDCDPLPLIEQVLHRHGDRFHVRYVERGADRFIIDFERA